MIEKTKLGTHGIKALISLWLEGQEQVIIDCYGDDYEHGMAESFVDGKQWLRENRCLARTEYGEDAKQNVLCLHEAADTSKLGMAALGEVSIQVGDEDYDRCIFRMFIPSDDRLADNWRLEVVTTPTDQYVMSYAFIAD